MDNLNPEQLLLGIFWRWQAIFVCLGVYITTFIVRTIVENVWVGAKDNRIWTAVVLPLGPIFNGAALAFAPGASAEMIQGYVWAQLTYGGLCGLASGWVYARYRDYATTALKQAIKVVGGAAATPAPASDKKDDDTDPPAVS